MKDKSKIIHLAVLFIILALALGLRINYIKTDTFTPLQYDAKYYDIMARQIADTGVVGYKSDKPNAYVTPGYPFFLAFMYKFFNASLDDIRFIQVLMSVLTIFVFYKLAMEYLRPGFALFAAFLMAIYPSSIYATGRILTEVIFTLLFALYFYIFILGLKKESKPLMFVSGVFFALSVFIRTTPLMFVVVAFGYFMIVNKKVKEYVKYGVVFIIPLFLVMMPWWIRNYMVYNQLVVFTTSSANPLLRGAEPYFIDAVDPIIRPYARHVDDLTRNALWKQEAIKEIKYGLSSNPVGYLKWFIFGKINYFWFNEWMTVKSSSILLISLGKIMHWVVVLVGWLGAALSAFKNKKDIHILALFLIYFTFIHVVYLTISRYSYPAIPIVIILAMYFIEYFYSLIERKIQHA